MQLRYMSSRISSNSTFLALAALAAGGFAATTTATVATTASPAATKATGPDTAFTALVDHFLAQPNKENFTAVQDRILADRGYDETARGLEDMLDLYRQKEYQKAIDRFQAAMPDLALSPQAHFYAARCYEELGKKELQKKETACVRACLQGLLATGDGSPERPFVVTHASDEYDLLTCPLKTESKSQTSTHKKGRWYDVLECASGKTYWFDITRTFGQDGKSIAAHSAAAASADSTESSAARPAAKSRTEYAKPIENQTAKPAVEPVDASPRELALPLVSTGKEAPSVPAVASRLSTIPAEAFVAYDRGVEAIKRADYDRAIAELDEVLRMDPASADALFERGVTYIEKRNYHAAYGDLSRSIRLRPNLALAYYERGLALWYQGDETRFDEAIADFDEAIRLIPSDFLAWRSRAMLWFAKRNYGKAIDDFNEAIRLQPDDVDRAQQPWFCL